MKKIQYAIYLFTVLSLTACENTDQQSKENAEVSVKAKDGNISIDANGIKQIADSGASINISKSGNVSVNGKNIGVNVDSTGVNVKMQDGKGIAVDSNKIKVNIGGFKVNIEK